MITITLPTFYSVTSCVFSNGQYQLFEIIDKKDCHYFLKQPLYKSQNNITLAKMELEYEFKLLKKINNTITLQPYELNSQITPPSMLLAHVEGRILSDYTEQNKLSYKEKCLLAIALTDALITLHKLDIILQNLTPSNVLVTPHNTKGFQVSFIDLNFATESNITRFQSSNRNILASHYFSPEQTGKVNQLVDYHTDLYNLGLLLYELFTGEVAFQADTLRELVYLHVAQSANFEKLADQPAIASVIAKLLKKDFSKRYQNGQCLRENLVQAMSFPNTPVQSTVMQDGILRISNALFGRDDEIKTLLKAAVSTQDGQLQLVLVSGYSGIGKSVLVKELQKPVSQHNGYFLSGKFEQIGIKAPLKAFIQAFQSLIQQRLAEPEEAITAWKHNLQKSVGQNAQILCEVLPELHYIFNNIVDVPQLSPSDELNRFVMTFKAFIQASCIGESLTVLFLDDMQWADDASLLLLESLCLDFTLHHLLIICAYRSNEVDPLHIFSKTVNSITEQKGNINRIELVPLASNDISMLLKASLSETLHPISELTEILLEKTQGNPFFTIQLLDSLWQANLLYFKNKLWHWDIDAIKQEDFTDNVVDLMTTKIEKLPLDAIQLLKVSSAIGSRFNLNLLLNITDFTLDKLLEACNICLKEKFIYLLSGNHKALYLNTSHLASLHQLPNLELKFLHDRIQQAAYELLPIIERPTLHVKIGRKIYQGCDDKLLDENLFEIMAQINQGTSLLSQAEQQLYAKLNHRAGIQAKRSGAYTIALDFLLASQTLLPKEIWKQDHRLGYDIYLSLLQTQYLCTLYSDASLTSKVILKNTPNLVEQVPIYITQILNFIGNNQMEDAAVKCASVVNSLGFDLVELPPDTSEHFATNSLMASKKEITALENLPDMEDEYAKAALAVLAIGCAPAYFSSATTFAKFCNTMLSICINKGNSSDSAYAYAIFGLYCSGLEHHDSAYRYCEAGFHMLERYDNTIMKPQIYEIFNVHVKHWCDPFRDSLPFMHKGVVEGKRTGGIEFASYNAAFSCPYLLFSGKSMPEIWHSAIDYWTLLTQFKQNFCITYAAIWLSLIQKIQGIEQPHSEINANTFTPYTNIDVLLTVQNKTTLYSYYQSHALYHLFIGDYEHTYKYAQQANNYSDAMYGMRSLLENEICLAVSIAMSKTIKDNSQAVQAIEQCLSKLVQWDKTAQGANSHKVILIKAMLALKQGNTFLSLSLIQQAGQVAMNMGFMQDYALAQLLCFDIYNSFADDHIKLASFINAINALDVWGAYGIITIIFSRFPHLAKSSNYNLKQHQNGTTNKNNITPLFKEDMTALLETLKSLSSEIDEHSLQQKILHTVATIIGAEKAHLLDVSNKKPTIIAGFKGGAISPLFDADKLYSQTALNYCLSTHIASHSGDALSDKLYQKDSYVQQYKIRSLLCIPIIGKKSILAVLYLENNMSPHCFNEQDIQKINILVKQVAMNLENAQLYTALTQENEERKLAESALAVLNKELEQRVVERTHALQSSNQNLADSILQLQQAQGKLVESEKMASLGGLVAGIAHEVNTPIGSALGAASHLLNIVNTVNTDYQNATLTESDFEKMLTTTNDSMNIVLNNLQRAAELIHSFKRVAVDQTNEQLIKFELVEYIQNVIISLKPKYKHLELSIKLTGLQHLLIVQTPGAIAQLVTNLLLNAIAHGFSHSSKGEIEINIREHFDDVKLTFKDDGVGIEQSIIHKIFDPFYTTKRGQGGSGLGLHVTYNLVTQTLQGNIHVESILGQGTKFTVQFPKDLTPCT